MVKHSVNVQVRALGLDGKVMRIKAAELYAQALEHEINHLNGILYIDRLVSPDSLWKMTEVEGDQVEPDEDWSEGDDKERPEACTSQTGDVGQ
jgi:peptide deformylase